MTAMMQSVLAQDSLSIAQDSIWKSLALDEVVVKSQLPTTRVKADAMRTQVSGTVLERTGTAQDLLRYIPRLEASAGSVSVVGRGTAEVYLNGRRLYDLGELERLQATDILHVDVVEHPGARYAASTKAVVRLTVKRPQGEGWGFRNQLSASHHFGTTWSDMQRVNYRRGGLDLTASLQYMDYRFGQDQVLTLRTNVSGQRMEQVGDERERGTARYIDPTVQLNYVFNERHAVGLRYSCSDNFYQHATATLDNHVSLDGTAIEQTLSDIYHDWKIRRHTLNTYYNGKIGLWTVDVNADGVSVDNTMPIVTTETSQSMTAVVDNRNTSSNRLYAAKNIASRTLWGGILSIGAEYTNSVRKDYASSSLESIGASESRVVENIASIFTEYEHHIGRATLNAGMRYEYVDSKFYEGNRLTADESHRYSDLFPSLSLTVPVGRAQVSLSYTKDISRPQFQYLTSNVMYVNRHTRQTGNPRLRPAYQHDISLRVSYRWASLTAAFQREKDAMSVASDLYDPAEPLVSRMTCVNLPAFNSGYASLVLSPTIGIWHPQWSATIFLQHYNCESIDGESTLLNHPLGELKWQNIFSLPADFTLTATAQLTTRGDNGNQRRNREKVSTLLMLQRSFFGSRLAVMCYANNPFPWADSDYTSYGPRQLRFDKHIRRTLGCRVTYKFNEAPSKYRGSGAGQSQKSRM